MNTQAIILTPEQEQFIAKNPGSTITGSIQQFTVSKYVVTVSNGFIEENNAYLGFSAGAYIVSGDKKSDASAVVANGKERTASINATYGKGTNVPKIEVNLPSTKDVTTSVPVENLLEPASINVSLGAQVRFFAGNPVVNGLRMFFCKSNGAMQAKVEVNSTMIVTYDESTSMLPLLHNNGIPSF